MMKKQGYWIIILVLCLAGCLGNKEDLRLYRFQGEVFGTYYSVAYYSHDLVVEQTALDSLFARFNASLSYYDPNSLISRINRGETDSLDYWFETVLQRSLEIARETSGAFDPTLAPLINAWGFGFRNREKITPELIDSLKALTGYRYVTVQNGQLITHKQGIQFDFNAIAKGYAADVAGNFLEGFGIESYLVEIGGDLIARGRKPDGTLWRIGLEIPAESADAPQQWEYLIEVSDRGLATSGNYRRYYEQDGFRYSHTLDPTTGFPVRHPLLSVSVLAPDAMTADAMATAFMVMGLEKALGYVESNPDLEAYFITADSSGGWTTKASSGLNPVRRSR